MAGRLDAVLPLAAADAERAQILFRSLEAFFEPLGTCWVVVPDAEVPAVRGSLPHGPYAVLTDSEVVPELALEPRPHGWHAQQLLKLAIASRVESDFYLTLDADVFCVRRTTYEELFRHGRALAQITPPHHPEWNDDAERVLGLPRSGRQHGVTPAILSRDGVLALQRHVEEPSGAGWRTHLLRSLPWTEYSLYNTFLEGTGRWDELHVDGGEEALYGNSVWIHGQWPEWGPGASFRPDAPFFFSVVQSATRIPPAAVWERIAPYVGAPAAGVGFGSERAEKKAVL